MKTFYYLFLSAFLLFLQSCSVKEQDKKEIVSKVSLDNKHWDNLNYDLSVIKLETNDSVLLGSIRTIEKLDNKLYISNRNGIHIFDTKGKFIKRIKKGAGPGEIKQVTAMDINDKFKELVIVDNGCWLKIYDLEGSYLKQYYTAMLIYDAVRLNSSVFALHSGYSGNNQNHLIYLFDTEKGKVVKRDVPSLDLALKNLSILTYNNFVKQNDNFIFSASNSKKVYKLDSLGNVTLFNILDFGELLPPSNYIERFKRAGNFMNKAYNDDYIAFITYYYKFKEITFVGLKYKEYNCGIIENDNKDKIYLSSISELFGFPQISSLTHPVAMSENLLIFALEPSDLFERVDEKNDSIKEILIGKNKIRLNATDNPVVILVKFK